MRGYTCAEKRHNRNYFSGLTPIAVGAKDDDSEPIVTFRSSGSVLINAWLGGRRLRLQGQISSQAGSLMENGKETCLFGR